MESGNAIILFQPNGVVELRADPGGRFVIEIRTERGSGRAERHEWPVGERTGGVEIIRYDRGQPVDQHRLSRGNAARVAVPDHNSTLRLQTFGQAGPPRLLELRLLPVAGLGAAARTGTPIPAQPTGPHPVLGTPGLPHPEIVRPRTLPPLRVSPTAAPPRTVPPTSAPKPRGTVNELLEAIERRLSAQLAPVMARLNDIELHLEAQGAVVDESGAGPTSRAPAGEALAAQLAGELSGPLTQLTGQLTGQLTEQLTGQLTEQLTGQLTAHEDAIEARLSARDAALTAQLDARLVALQAALAPSDPAATEAAQAARDQARRAELDAALRGATVAPLELLGQRLDALGQRLDAADTARAAQAELIERLSAGQLDPLALRDALADTVRLTQDAGLEPMLVGLDRLEQQQVRQHDGFTRLEAQLERLTDRIAADTERGVRLEVLQSQLERLEGILRAPSPDSAKLDQLAVQLKRVETSLASGPSVDTRLTVMQSQLSRIEEGAGAITPELFEILAARLEAVDPRPGFTRVDDKFAAVAEAIELISETVERKLESRLGEATPLAGRLARLEQAVDAVAGAVDSLDDGLGALLDQTPAQSERLEDQRTLLTEQGAWIEETLTAQGAAIQQLAARPAPDPAPALAALEQALAARLEALPARLEALDQRLTQTPDPSAPLERIEDALERLDRRLRGEGNQAERAVTAAMAVVQSLDVREPLEAIEDRLRRLERAVSDRGPTEPGADRADGYLAEGLGARLDALAAQLDASPRALDGLADRFDDLEARLAPLLAALAGPEDAPEDAEDPGAVVAEALGGLADRFDDLEARLAPLLGALADPEAAPEAPAVEPAGAEPVMAALDALAGRLGQLEAAVLAPQSDVGAERLLQRVVSVEQRLADLADLDLGARLDGLQARLAPPDADGALTARLDARLESLQHRLDALPAPSADPQLLAHFEALQAALTALTERAPAEAPSGPDPGPALQAIQIGLMELATKLERQSGVAAPAPTRPMLQRLDALSAKLDTLGPGASAEIGPPVALLERLDALAGRLDTLEARLAQPGTLTPELTARLDALQARLDAPAAPDPDLAPLAAQLTALIDDLQRRALPSTPPPAARAPEPRAPLREVARQSPDGQMLDQIDLLIDTVHSQHLDQPSLRGVLSGARLAEISQRVLALRDPLGPKTAAALLDPLLAHIEDSRRDPLSDAQQALIEGQFADAIAGVVQVLKREARAPLTVENLERLLIGVAKGLWDADPGSFAGPARGPLDALLAELDLRVTLPEPNTTWQPKEQRVQARRPGRPGEALNRILEVHAPGFCRGDAIIEKASVTISD